jgi:hypothetical protein
MKIKLERMDLDAFVRLQQYIGKETNRYDNGLIVSVCGIDEANDFIVGAPSSKPTQYYFGVTVNVVDGRITKPQLEELVSLLYESVKQ